MNEKLNVVILAGKNLPLVLKKKNNTELFRISDNNENLRTLDWIINFLEDYNLKTINVVIGKNSKKYDKDYLKKINFIKNSYSNSLGNLFSLSLALEEFNNNCLITYGDTVFNNSTLDKILSFAKHDFVIGYDSSWQNRYAHRSSTSFKKVELVVSQDTFLKKIFKGYDQNENFDGEFCGLFLISPKGIKIILQIFDIIRKNNHFLNFKDSSVIDLISYLVNKNLKIKVVDIAGGWSEMDATNDFKSFIFRGKADTLINLEKSILNGKILPQINFTLEDWHKSKSSIINNIIHKNWDSLVVRSSGVDEDKVNLSNAGQYTSLLNILNKKKDITKAVENVILVINSKSKKKSRMKNKILIQPFLKNTSINGVVFSCDIKNASPYFVINYDENENTAGVTSGTSKTQKITYISRLKKSLPGLPNQFSNIIKLMKELENKTGSLIDIEFGIQNDNLYLFQVRPLVILNKNNQLMRKSLISEMKLIKKNLNKFFNSKEGIFGSSNVFSDMTDWNPAEMIGIYPKPLSISLYEHLITNKTWAKSRAKIGYMDLCSEKLMTSLAGHPYINVRNSFNSLIPKGLSNDLGNKLVNYYISKLNKYPFLHDKVEFEIVFSCYTPKTKNDLLNLKSEGFSKYEIDKLFLSLKHLTENIFKNPELSISKQLSDVKTLEIKYNEIINSKGKYDLNSILNICIKNGTYPFAILARYAFIASKILKDMQKIGLVSKQNINKFLTSIETVASESSKMYDGVQNGAISIKKFLKKFGHLRPGTYDLLQERYDEAPEKYFNKLKTKNRKQIIKKSFDKKPFKEIFNSKELLSIQIYLDTLAQNFTTDEFISFVVEAIKGREYAKFQFTKIISHVLNDLKKFANQNQIDKEDLVFLNIQEIINFISHNNGSISEKNLKNKIQIRKNKYKIYKNIKLPSFINSINNIDFFTLFYDKPNFITNKIITNEALYIENLNEYMKIQGKIILIDNADPGFDWIFTHNIKGLITKFGGVASHMSIRCNEFSIPAAIGCGELLFDNLINSNIITLDCENEMIKSH